MMTEQIDASPTKEFFIDMLTRDIALDRAILDLIDNSIDAARKNDKKFADVTLTIEDNKFIIFDNCGGMDINAAKDYAFRFGRSKKSPPTPNSVGQFGVGMKRTLFKLGRNFHVASKKNNEYFCINIDVDEWKKNEEWTFDIVYDESQANYHLNDGETIISVSNLYREINEQLKQAIFINSLSHEISVAHFKSINSGMNINLNGAKVSKYELTFLSSPELGVYRKLIDINGVSVNVMAGVSSRSLEEGGWYIICNGRLVEFAEQSNITGWQVDGIPKYHPDYAYFRGVVEFNCEDSSKLPWTTTKTGIDRDNAVYRAALHEMKVAARPVISFLKERMKEDMAFRDGAIDIRPLNNAIDNANNIQLFEVEQDTDFVRPDAAEKKLLPEVGVVQYTILQKDLELAKEALNVTTNKEVGVETFKYYMKYELQNG